MAPKLKDYNADWGETPKKASRKHKIRREIVQIRHPYTLARDNLLRFRGFEGRNRQKAWGFQAILAEFSGVTLIGASRGLLQLCPKFRDKVLRRWIRAGRLLRCPRTVPYHKNPPTRYDSPTV
jgi:hypothetical protein